MSPFGREFFFEVKFDDNWRMHPSPSLSRERVSAAGTVEGLNFFPGQQQHEEENKVGTFSERGPLQNPKYATDDTAN